jgi:hypothetical protein
MFSEVYTKRAVSLDMETEGVRFQFTIDYAEDVEDGQQ